MPELIPWEPGKIGPRIRLVREARGFRMADLEARVGLSAGNLYQIERGGTRPPGGYPVPDRPGPGGERG